ncbi:hypothetical protein [Streptomyces antibioticus]|uniref:hypothetical protein n=1 Tax=Streptomyces antibioticus TaxID=1890 RepID=UPI0036DFA0C9
MTQSGQGEEPSARPAREGIVLPSDGGEPLLPGMTPGGSQPAAPTGAYGSPQYGRQEYGQQQYDGQSPAAGQTWGDPWGPAQQPPAQQPPAPQQWGTPQPDAWGAGAGPLPPEAAPAPSYDQGPPQPSYGQGGHGGGHGATGVHASTGVPLPPVDEGATQYIPPVAAGPADDGRTQYLPPVPAAPGGDEGATQYIPPVGPGALPPENPAESTHYLGARHTAQGPTPGAAHSDADATQYIPPVPGQQYPAPGGGPQPPAGFENLFRDGPGGDGPAGATQHLPRIPGQGQGQGYGTGPAAGRTAPPFIPPVSRDDDYGDDGRGGGRGGRTGSRVPLIAAIGVALAVLGVGAGALLGGGGGDDGGDDGSKNVAASAPAAEQSPSAKADAAKEQAVALDKLLADSGSSRAAVIAAVADVKACSNLQQAASDLRDAGRQRTDLVTKLADLSVDQLPDHAALTAALTKAWQASASADDHYAAWADQVAQNRKRNCKKGQARGTAETQQGNRDSGTASTQKAQAAELWNAIARKYGLTQRQPTQL